MNRKKVLEANKYLFTSGLVSVTWGNVSYIDRESNVVYIKPSGVDLFKTSDQHISKVSVAGTHISGKKPSVDTPTHLEVYRKFLEVGSIVHTHSKYATIFAQANKDISCMGTTHADYFDGAIPCIPCPNVEDVKSEYEANTGKAIVNYFTNNDTDPMRVPAVLVSGHGPFCWGRSTEDALENAYVLEKIAEMAYKTLILSGNHHLPEHILRKHFDRKHGEEKYYGQ
tara:strand:+ start:19 stop:696 length:678 start_codon:yes stop_codon:yes gene_type:complete